ncbi:MAG: ATP-binding protein, partial [Gammaproteobacteria bacterium]|nr:ATP-binding protein [Gammaproteobacteria bacterium]
FLGVATLGATISEPWWGRLLFFALSMAIGVFAIFRAAKEKNRLTIGLSAIATALIAILSIWQLSGPVSSFFTPTPETEPRPLPLPPHLHGAPDPLKDRFVGRAREFLELDAAWEGIVSGKSSTQSPTRTVGIIAWGGFGKSTLARQWLWRRFEKSHKDTPPDKIQNRPDALLWRAFQAGEGADAFALAAISYFSDRPGLELDDIPNGSGQRIAALRAAIGERRYILVLDGLEVEQDATRREGFGRLESAFLRDLLRAHTAGRLGQGLLVVTSRLPLTDIESNDAYDTIDLERRALNDDEVRLLLKLEGVREITESELAELIEISGRHPLALKTLANILAKHNGGRAAGWRKFDSDVFDIPPGQEKQRHLWRVLGWTDRLLQETERRVMSTLAHFREPVHPDWLYHLLAPGDILSSRQGYVIPAKAGTGSSARDGKNNGRVPSYSPEELALPGEPITGREIRDALDALVGLQLLRRDQNNDRYAMHGLVREHFRRSKVSARDGKNKASEDQTQIHTRLYRLYTSIIQPVWRPDGLDGLRPLYEAVYHGTKAGLHAEARTDVYRDRILRGTGSGGFYSSGKLGAFDAEIEAVTHFFDEPWKTLSPNLSPADQAWLLSEAAVRLRALGQLREALAPMRAGVDMAVEQENWSEAAIRASNLSELELTLGNVTAAVEDGARSVTFADRSGAWDMRMIMRTTHANALHQAGQREHAMALFIEAEKMQAENQPQYPRLYSLWGFRYADLLLAEAARAARHPNATYSDRAPLRGADNQNRRTGRVDKAEGRIHREKDHREAVDARGTRLSTLPSTFQAGDSEAQATPNDRSAFPRGNVGTRTPPHFDAGTREKLIAACDAVTERAKEALPIAKRNNWLLDIALDNLTLARAALYKTLLPIERKPRPQGASLPPDIETHLTAAVDGLR